MLSRFKIGRVAGIDVFVHWTFVFAPLFVIFQTWNYGWAVIGMALVLLACFVGCVLLHEFGHALAARIFGISTQDIIVTPIGGLARLQGVPKNRPTEELVITLAGPAVNLVLATVFLAYLLITHQSLVPEPGVNGLVALPKILFWANILLCFINLIPAFPMDGGRILRSVLAFFMDHSTATLIAGLLGRILAITCVLFGIWQWEAPFVIVGLFVYFAAEAEISLVQSTEDELAIRPPSGSAESE